MRVGDLVKASWQASDEMRPFIYLGKMSYDVGPYDSRGHFWSLADEERYVYLLKDYWTVLSSIADSLEEL